MDKEKILAAEEKRLQEVDKITDEYLKNLKKVYLAAKKEIDAEIAKFYAEFPDMDYTEVRKLLKPVQLLRVHKAAKRAYKDSKAKGYTANFTQFCKNLEDKMRISRLEMLQLEIYSRIEEISAYQREQMQEDMKKIYIYQYQHSAFDDSFVTGIGVNLGAINDTMVDLAVKGDWLESNFAKRNNVNCDRIIAALNETIPQAFILGKNPKQFAEIIADKLGVSYNNAVRLARTEYIHIATEARYQQMKDTDLFDEYQYISTLDNRTSDICQNMNNKVFKFSEYKQGVTAPPLHPHCRSTIIPYFEDEQNYKRIAKDKTGRYVYVDGNISFADYKRLYLS